MQKTAKASTQFFNVSIMRWRWSLLVTLLFLAAGCREHHSVSPAFYSWKTRYNPTEVDSATLRSVRSRKLYLRFFDVDWSGAEGRILPRAIVGISAPADAGVVYVPVIFITSRTLSHLPDTAAAATLAHNISTLTQKLCAGARIFPHEIQLDCDWTAGTRDSYFALLRALKREVFIGGKILSATIRLHQIKYAGKSGIPPTDRGMLMCYNMGNTRKPGAHNSILDAAEAEEYLTDLEDYPLPLDVALPLFRWCLLFREDMLVGILRDVPTEEADEVGFLKKQTGPLYRCTADTVWHGYALQSGDVIRTESPSTTDIRRIAHFTARRIRNGNLTVALYHLDSLTCSKYSPDELESFFAAYR